MKTEDQSPVRTVDSDDGSQPGTDEDRRPRDADRGSLLAGIGAGAASETASEAASGAGSGGAAGSAPKAEPSSPPATAPGPSVPPPATIPGPNVTPPSETAQPIPAMPADAAGKAAATDGTGASDASRASGATTAVTDRSGVRPRDTSAATGGSGGVGRFPGDGAMRGDAPDGTTGPAAAAGPPAGTGGGRMLGLGAAAGLGIAATAGLLASGHSHAGGAAAHPGTADGSGLDHGPGAPHAGTAHAGTANAGTDPTAFTPNPLADQGYSPSTSTEQTLGAGHASVQPADAGSSGTLSTPAGAANTAPAHAAPQALTHTAPAHTAPQVLTHTVPTHSAGQGLTQPGTVPQSAVPGHQTPAQPAGTDANPAASPYAGTTQAGQSVAGSDPAQGTNGAPLSSAQQQPTGHDAGVPPDPSGSATTSAPQDAQPTLYDSSGHPVMTADQSGHWHPVTDAGTPAPANHSPVLYDSSGRPVAMTDNGGNVVPISASQQSTHPATGQYMPPTGQNATQPLPTGTSAVPQDQTSYEWVQGPPVPRVLTSNADIADYMRGLSPADREKEIQKALDQEHVDIPGGLQQWMKYLPPDFWNKDTYSFTYTDENGVQHKKDLNTVAAAATALTLKANYDHLKTDVGALSSTAISLESKASEVESLANSLVIALSNVEPMWDILGADINDSADQKLEKARGDFAGLPPVWVGGDPHNPLGNISSVADSLRVQAQSLHMAASKYIQIETDNLSQFNMDKSVDDPRPDWEKRRYKNGEDATPYLGFTQYRSYLGSDI